LVVNANQGLKENNSVFIKRTESAIQFSPTAMPWGELKREKIRLEKAA